jgi:hypothetical protein
MQNAHDLNASRDDSIEDEIREFDQSPCPWRYIRPCATGLGKPSQCVDADFQPVLEIVGRSRVDVKDLKPEIDQIAACTDRVTDRRHLLSFRFAHGHFAFGRAPQFDEIDGAGVPTLDPFAPRPSQAPNPLGFFAVGAFKQSQSFAHHLASRGIAAGINFGPD